MNRMSHGDLTGTASRSGQNHCVKGSLKRNESPEERRASAHMATKQTSDSGSPAVRERVLKDVGSTSTFFIGPECRPKTLAAKRNIEETLSEFYKELENIDSTDGTYHTPGEGSGSKPLKKSKRKEICNTNPETSCPLDTDASQERHSPRPHWYQNEPYHPRRQRPSVDSISGAHTRNHSQHLPPFQRPPYPRFHRPPNCGPPPPFSYAFPRPPDSGPHMNHYWNCSDTTGQYQGDLRFPPMHRFPPPDEYGLTSQDFDGHSPHHFDRNRWGYNHDNESSHVDVQWSSSANNRWSQLGKDSDWRQRVNTAELQEEEDLSHKAHVCDSSLALILMRGLPGSGKSTKAQELLSTGPNGLILSTDDYFAQENGYLYDPSLVGVAHECNQRRAKEAMHNSRSPVIIDNTNIQAWEMKPYVKMALENGYRIYFHEPDTRWKFDPFELEKRNKHGVPQEKIAQMLDRFSFPISIDIVMSSQEPAHVNMRQQPEQQRSRTNNPDSR